MDMNYLINKMTAFAYAISSFKKYYEDDMFIFMVRNDYGAYDFVKNEVTKYGIKNYKIKVINYQTEGQADTVNLALQYVDYADQIFIFNIDTYRDNYKKPGIIERCDGYLEVFEGDGDAWSFVLPGDEKTVIRTAEKDRISNLCSNGLYFFKNKETFINAFDSAKSKNNRIGGEYYIAPIYNELILKGLDVRYDLVDMDDLKFFGTPEQYNMLIN